MYVCTPEKSVMRRKGGKLSSASDHSRRSPNKSQARISKESLLNLTEEACLVVGFEDVEVRVGRRGVGEVRKKGIVDDTLHTRITRKGIQKFETEGCQNHICISKVYEMRGPVVV
jgi:hypothetical protein